MIPCPNCRAPISRRRLLRFLLTKTISCPQCRKCVCPSYERRTLVGCLGGFIGVLIFSCARGSVPMVLWLLLIVLWAIGVALTTMYFVSDLQLEEDATDYF